MARSQPMLRSLNGGAFSPWMAGRTDLDRYPTSMKRLRNSVALPQGPAIRRSGSRFYVPIYNEAAQCWTLPFVYAGDDAWLLEFSSDGRIRFLNDDGLLTRAPVSVALSVSGGFLQVTSASLGAVNGEELALAGFTPQSNVSSRIVRITAVVGNTYTTNFPIASVVGIAVAPTAARVYHIAHPYNASQLPRLRGTQILDVMYLHCDSRQTRKISRFNTFDWRLQVVELIDGPYLKAVLNAKVTLSHTGVATPLMTDITTPSGEAFASTNNPQAFQVFDRSFDTLWTSQTPVSGADVRIGFKFVAPVIIKAYAIAMAASRAAYTIFGADDTYSPLQRSPGAWKLQARNADVDPWTTLDTKINYVAYANGRTQYLSIPNKTAYSQYSLLITDTYDHLDIPVSIGEFQLMPATPVNVTLTFDSIEPINGGQGFLSTDVDRDIRLRGVDGLWRWATIQSVVDTDEIVVHMREAPMGDMDDFQAYRLGIFSTTTGFPSCGAFIGDRLWLAGTPSFPDLLVGSFVGGYEVFKQTDDDGTVNDDNAVYAPLNSPMMAKIQWIEPYQNGLVIGTEGGPWIMRPTENQTNITARGAFAAKATGRGAAFADPIRSDSGFLFIDRAKRGLRECQWSLEADNFKTPLMSIYATHMGSPRFEQQAFMYEPHSIDMIRRVDGTIAGFTYNREENVLCWHEHFWGGSGFIENVVALPSGGGLFDTLWVVVRRTIDGQTRRYHERLQEFWSDAHILTDAWYVDCGIRYQGVPVNELYGFWYAEGMTVHGLANGSPITPQVVTGGRIDLPENTTDAVIGFGFDSDGETSNLEIAIPTGSGQGVNKRIQSAKVRVWQSGGGYIGRGQRFEEDLAEETYPIPMRQTDDLVEAAIPLRTEDIPVPDWPQDYTGDTTIVFRQPAEIPLPLNIIAIMPRVDVQLAGGG